MEIGDIEENERQASLEIEAVLRKFLEEDKEITPIVEKWNLKDTPEEHWAVSNAFQNISDEFMELAMK